MRSCLLLNLTKIDCELPEVNVVDLSRDQQYLNDIRKAVSTGHCSVSLSHHDPGKLVMSRWVTLANRALRLYKLVTPRTSFVV